MHGFIRIMHGMHSLPFVSVPDAVAVAIAVDFAGVNVTRGGGGATAAAASASLRVEEIRGVLELAAEGCALDPSRSFCV